MVLVMSLKHLNVNKMTIMKFNDYNDSYNFSFSDELLTKCNDADDEGTRR